METQQKSIETLLDELEQVAARAGAAIYEILFRKAGVGIRFFESDRAGPRPQWDGDADTLGGHNQANRAWLDCGLVVHGYHPTLPDALAKEIERLSAFAGDKPVILEAKPDA